jgi:hypothetical protein
MTIYYEEWMKKEYVCEGCSWQGTAEASVRGGLHRGIYLELYCPQCNQLLDVVIFQETHSCGHKKEGLTEEQLKALQEAEQEERQYREQCLRSAGQLPDLPDGDLPLVWDQVEGDTQILNGEAVIWSEPVAYEGFERYERIALLLKEKYGDRVKDLAPTDRSLLFLYGDYAPSLDYVAKVRKELFGVDARID